MALAYAKILMHLESDYGRMIGGCFANASAASPPAVYFAKQLPTIRLLPTRTSVMGLRLSKCHSRLTLRMISLEMSPLLSPVRRIGADKGTREPYP